MVHGEISNGISDGTIFIGARGVVVFNLLEIDLKLIDFCLALAEPSLQNRPSLRVRSVLHLVLKVAVAIPERL
ncbi:unannotated protein [freshwater metagenome]|uniref:Unannotated protein n=1 Tax=freshwater metagenome TaxID=449393 RepID=A0A6J5ZV43_9ZZZZ